MRLAYPLSSVATLSQEERKRRLFVFAVKRFVSVTYPPEVDKGRNVVLLRSLSIWKSRCATNKRPVFGVSVPLLWGSRTKGLGTRSSMSEMFLHCAVDFIYGLLAIPL